MQRLAAKKALKYPAVELTGLQARAVGRGFTGIPWPHLSAYLAENFGLQ